MSDTQVRPWEWRKAAGGWMLDTDRPGDRLFHAYDVNDNAACEPVIGLGASCEEPNEGSKLCPACVSVVVENPAGRDRRLPPHHPADDRERGTQE